MYRQGLGQGVVGKRGWYPSPSYRPIYYIYSFNYVRTVRWSSNPSLLHHYPSNGSFENPKASPPPTVSMIHIVSKIKEPHLR